MDIPDWASVIAVVVSVVAATTYIHARFSHLDRRIDNYAKMASKGTEAAIERPSSQTNPLTPEEASRLRNYIAKARRGEYFTPAEVEDYNQMVQRMESERPNDPGIWPLLAIGAFLAGLFSGSRKKEDQ